MGIINKEPFIVRLLSSMSVANLGKLKDLINGKGPEPVFYSLVPHSPALLTEAKKGSVELINLELPGVSSQNVYTGYLIYNDEYCVLIAYSGMKNQNLTLIEMELVNGNWQHQIKNCELTIGELRSELDDEADLETVTVQNITSGSEAAGKVIVADGEGGAEWGKAAEDVIANPTLSGTEANLEGLQVGDTKYKVPQGMEVVELGASSGTLTDEQFTILSGDNGIIKFSNKYFYKNDASNSLINYINYEADTDLIRIKQYEIQINISTKAYEYRIDQHAKPTVVANPTLSGSEAELIGLQIGNDKYKIPQGMQVVELNASGTLTDEQYTILSGDNALIKNSGGYFYKISDNESFLDYSEFISSGTFFHSARYYHIIKSNKNYSLDSVIIPKINANPTLSGSEAELLGLQIGTTKYRMPELTKTDGITFEFADNASYSLSAVANYASYVRIVGSAMIFVTSFNITKNSADAGPITVGSFGNIPNDIFAKLVGGAFLDEANTKAFVDGSFAGSVDAATALEKKTNLGVNYVDLKLQSENLVVGTTYHIRHMSIFLLTDNLSGIDHVLSNNSWAIIDEVAKAGLTSNYWSVGDAKTDLGTDGSTRTFRIVEIENDGSIVFEEVGLENGVAWNSTSNVDDDNAYNDYYISEMRNTHLPATLLKFSSALQNVITTTNVIVATNGTNGALLTLTDKLFLEAEKEVGLTTNSRTEEQNALTTYSYYVAHSTNADRVKRNQAGTGGTASEWWLRSPAYPYMDYVCAVRSSGSSRTNSAAVMYYFAPCFRIGTAQTGGLGKPLEYMSWSEIDTIAKAGTAANYFSVGDTKRDTGTDNVTRTFRIVDMDSRGITFEEVGLENYVVWDADDLNDYAASDMNLTHLPATLLKFSNDLQSAITTTNVKVAENGNSTAVVTVNSKLFLEAEKEVGSTALSRAEEQNALTTYSYYVTHNQNSDRVKYDQGGTSRTWWLRSPGSGSTSNVCRIYSNGSVNLYNANYTYFFAPCFRIGIADVNVSSTLENNSWDTIRSVSEAGGASNYWSVGDTKTDVGTDGVTRTFRIVDMSGLYGKHIVFEQVGLEGTDGTGATGVQWDAGGVNDYVASDMNVTVLPGVISRYSSALQSALTNTTVKVAENGTSGTIVDVTNKLFLEAEKEIGFSHIYSVQQEYDALSIFAYYVTHNQNSDRLKHSQSDSSASRAWWLRSPYSGYSNGVCVTNGIGVTGNDVANLTYRFAPCFSF